MQVASYICKEHVYSLEPIIDYSFIDTDIEKVKNEIDNIPLDEYKNKMIESVDQKYAYSLYVDNERKGFFYNSINDGYYYGRSIYSESDIAGTVVMLKHMFDITTAHKIIFAPHSNNLKYFKSMIRGDVIRSYNAFGADITITRSLYEEKGKPIYLYLGIAQWEQ